MKPILLSIPLISSLIGGAVPPPAPPAGGPFGAPEPAPVPAIDPVDGFPALRPVPAAPLRRALDQVGVAIAQVGDNIRTIAPRPMRGGDMFLSSGRGGRTLIIQSSDPNPNTYANLEEDLSVMYRILTKARKQDDGSGGFKLESLLTGSSSSVRNM